MLQQQQQELAWPDCRWKTDNPFAFRALALGYVKQDRNAEATDALITAVTLEPNVPQLRQQLFDILTATGRTLEAEAVARGEFP